LKWLEQELNRHYDIRVEDIQTGTSLSTTLPAASMAPETLSTLLAGDLVISNPSLERCSGAGSSNESQHYQQRDSRSVNFCFSAYVASFGYSFLPPPASVTAPRTRNEAIVKNLTELDRHFLLTLFQRWVQSVHPLFHPDYINERFLPFCNQFQPEASTPDQRVDLVLYYLSLANGAAYVKQAATSQDAEERAWFVKYEKSAGAKGLSANMLYEYSLELLSSTTSLECPSIPAIQSILLILMYASLQPSGNRQWQLSGIAIRVGLSRSSIS
jgi:hypothetical protein